jgi:hypothetical protein
MLITRARMAAARRKDRGKNRPGNKGGGILEEAQGAWDPRQLKVHREKPPALTRWIMIDA